MNGTTDYVNIGNMMHKTYLSSVTLPVEQLNPGLYEMQVENMDGSTDRVRVLKQ